MINVMDAVKDEGKNEVSEDDVVINTTRGRFAVIDGESGFGPFSGKEAAKILANALSSPKYNDLSLEQSVIAANNELRLMKKGNKIWESYPDVQKDIRNSCSFAAIQVTDEWLYYLQTGSCMIFVQYSNGTIRSLTYDHTAKFKEKYIEKHKKYFNQLKKGLNRNYSQKKLEDCYKNAAILSQAYRMQCRESSNTYEGFGTVDGSRNSSRYWESGRIPLMDIKKILLLSDGLQIPGHKPPCQETWLQTAKHIFNKKLTSTNKKINQMEKDDPLCQQYLRFEQSDDKAGILLEVVRD
ncbi:PP2C family serine/threonine-protein phosphatase [Rummeliibacillus sp. JY-2-4R]